MSTLFWRYITRQENKRRKRQLMPQTALQLGQSHGTKLKGFLGHSSLKPFISNDLAMEVANPIKFVRPGRGGLYTPIRDTLLWPFRKLQWCYYRLKYGKAWAEKPWQLHIDFDNSIGIVSDEFKEEYKQFLN